MSCPEDVKRRGLILYHNSFAGFQEPGGGGPNCFLLCFCKNLRDEEINQIKELSGSTTLEQGDFIGRDFLEINWTEYNKIEAILNIMLQLGYGYQVMTKSLVSFDPAVDKVFSRQAVEKKSIDQMKQLLSLCPNRIYDSRMDDIYFDPWNYITEEGRQFCNELRRMNKMQILSPPYDQEDNYFKWPIFQNYDPQTLLSFPTSVSSTSSSTTTVILSKNLKDEEMDDQCMICMDAEPNTMVLPCEHRVVCKKCSDGLKGTNDHHTCVRCRRHISYVLD